MNQLEFRGGNPLSLLGILAAADLITFAHEWLHAVPPILYNLALTGRLEMVGQIGWFADLITQSHWLIPILPGGTYHSESSMPWWIGALSATLPHALLAATTSLIAGRTVPGQGVIDTLKNIPGAFIVAAKDENPLKATAEFSKLNLTWMHLVDVPDFLAGLPFSLLSWAITLYPQLKSEIQSPRKYPLRRQVTRRPGPTPRRPRGF